MPKEVTSGISSLVKDGFNLFGPWVVVVGVIIYVMIQNKEVNDRLVKYLEERNIVDVQISKSIDGLSSAIKIIIDSEK